MIGRLLKNTEWARATDYLSPVFFQVVPTFAMGKRIATLASSYANKEEFSQLCLVRSEELNCLGIKVVSSPDKAKVRPLSAEQEFKILTLYFWQILCAKTPILDLRQSSFSSMQPNQILWSPRPLFATLDPTFAAAIRNMYRGFYSGNLVQFDNALDALDILHARELFFAHFGGSQSAMVFDLKSFRKTFHQLFVSCKTNRTRLHPDFLAFGAGLFTLYEHLERNKRTFDVRAAFENALALAEGGAWLEKKPLQ